MQTGKGILIPSILKVGNGTLKKIGQYLKAENLEQVVIFFGIGLIDLFGMDVMDSLKQEGITALEYSELDTVDIDDIITLAFAMPNKTIESIGHIIRFFSARIGRIAISACPYSTCRH